MLDALSKLKTKQLIEIITLLDKDTIAALCECIYNAIFTNLNIPKKKQKKIKSKFSTPESRKNIKIITKKSSSLNKKRKALQQEGEGISLIISTLLPLLANILE